MYAFEIILNGQPFRTISAGEFGMIGVDLMAHRIQQARGTIADGIRLWPHGMEAGPTGDHISWEAAQLKAGDVVTIRVIEIEKDADPPTERMTREELRKR